ncbi:MAG: glycosyltransferase family 39 protein [Candidatus Auribacterota bacterium]|nr:glycosyltransferase family 39 protein [Candidatus Auribacterota bacterium]
MKNIDSTDIVAGKRSGRMKWWGLSILIAAALIFRLLYFNQTKDTAVFHGYKMDHLDMGFFLSWARQISDGDILSDRSNHPYHFWHARVGTPEEWEAWYGGKRFHQSPLYPYLLAGLITAGFSVEGVKIIQALVGVGILLLTFAVAKRIFGIVVAFTAGILCLFYGPFYLYETQLLRTTWLTAIGLLSLLLCLWAAAAKKSWPWIFVGISAGLLFLFKAGFLPWLAAIGVYAIISPGNRKQGSYYILKILLALGTGIAICLSPLVVRNAMVQAPLLSSSSVGEVTFTFGNAGDVSGTSFEVSTFTGGILREGGGKFIPTILATVKTNPGGWGQVLTRCVRKFYAFWQGYETPNNANFYYACFHSPFLRFSTYTFLLLGPAALVGMGLALRRRREVFPLYLYVGAIIFPVLIFYHLSRFRLPAVPVLIIFAALFLVSAGRYLLGTRRVAGLVLILAMLVLLILLNPPWDHPDKKIGPPDFLIVATFFTLQGDFETAETELAVVDRVYPGLHKMVSSFRREIRIMKREKENEAVETGEEEGRRKTPPLSAKELFERVGLLDYIDEESHPDNRSIAN